jgi:hypothetical protein
MRSIINYISILAATLCFVACKKEGEQYNLQAGAFATSALTVSNNTAVLTAAKENDTALKYQWTAASFGGQPVISYILQLGRLADTTNNWATAQSFAIENGTRSFAFVTRDLNNLLNSMGLTPGTGNTVFVRIKANVNQYNGAASTVPPVYTNIITQQITSYSLDLYVPGDYQNWSPATAPKLAPVPGKAGMYEGYVYMPGAAQHYFKYTNAPDWNHTNYGDGGIGTFSTDGAAAGLSLPDGGYYYLTANLNNSTWTATKTTWSMLGGATPGGWNTDTQLSYDEPTQVWKVTVNMIKNGSFKFRANDAWALDFGLDASGKLAYADNPFLGYTAGLGDLTVPEDGNYTISLDLHIAGSYTFTLQKH